MDTIFSAKSSIDKYLQKILTPKGINSWEEDTLGRLRKFVSGGKMIRGCLAVFLAHAFGKNQTLDPLPLAAAIELIEAAFLIHDDIMDQDELRRGHASIYKQYQKLAEDQNYRETTRTGESLTICVGDAAIFLAYEQISKLNLSSPIHSQLLKFISSQWQQTCFGQMQDIALSVDQKPATPDAILAMYRAKTISYTFSVPLISAAIANKQPAPVIRLLEKLGEATGFLFQLHDDELNLYGDAAITGKPVGSDERENKQTYWRAVSFDKQRVYKFMDKLQKEANLLIQQLPISSSRQQDLSELVSFVRNRPK